VLVRPDGTIGSPVAQGSEAIKALVYEAAQGRVPTQRPLVKPRPQGEPCPDCGKVHPTNGNGHAHPVTSQGTRVGELAPPIELEDLKGSTVKLEEFRGEKTLVLFWNPGCGFCEQMLPDLKDLENSSSEEASKILLVSAGTEEANKAMGLRSSVVLDPQFAVGRAFGAAGTPSAVLVDEEGRIASEVAVGAPAVLELARASRHTEKA
jgi:peroxiredoxin